MEAKISVRIHDMPNPSRLPKSIKASGNSVAFTCPAELKEAGFPTGTDTFNVEQVLDNPSSNAIVQNTLAKAAANFNKKRENAAVFSYGARSTPKRQLMYGSATGEGFAAKVVADAVSSGTGIFAISCFVVGQDEHLTDLVNYENELGVIVESVKEGPRVRMVERARVTSSSDVAKVFKKIAQNYEKVFAPALATKQPTPELEALPPYKGDTIMLQLYRYESEEDFAAYSEANSMNFIALGDSERPVPCGVEASQQAMYEKTQRILLSAAGIVSSIKCNRLRIPFGKSKMSQLLRRSHNAEKGNANNALNAPTNTPMLIHCFTDGAWSEETHHCLSMVHRVCNMLGSTGIGSMLRDLPAEKWRLDQDVADLRDELVIAKTVCDYKPSIYESAKPIANIKEEEPRRITAIQAKRDEAREKQLALIRSRAKDEAAKMIKEQEASSGTTLAELEKMLEAKKRENASLQNDRDERTRDYEQALEKIRKKKEEEESAAESLRQEVLQLEEELASRQAAIQAKQKQLELAKLDKAKGREAILREREGVQAMRRNVLEVRRRQREQWIQQIKEINEKVLEQARALAEERRQNGEHASAKEEAAERAVAEDIRTIEEYLPKLISLEDTPVNPEETESVRRQFDEVFAHEKQVYPSRIEEEKARKEKLEKGLEAYRSRILEAAQAKKKENVRDAVKKEQHLSSLVDQVPTYLRQGVKMTKVSSNGHLRRRFYFVSEDCKRIHSCEMDNQGGAINRRKPPVTIWIKDIKKVVLGIYTPSFVSFSSESHLAKTRLETVTDNGTCRHDPTQSITPANPGINNHRAFALLLRGGKSLEVVCDSDTDCEAWIVGLRRLLHISTPIEVTIEKKLNAGDEEPNAGGDNTVEMKYGAPLDIRNMHGFVSLSPEEAQLCSENHIPPALFLRVKQEAIEKSQGAPLTVYDIRVTSSLDLYRSITLYSYLVENHVIPLPF